MGTAEEGAMRLNQREPYRKKSLEESRTIVRNIGLSNALKHTRTCPCLIEALLEAEEEEGVKRKEEVNQLTDPIVSREERIRAWLEHAVLFAVEHGELSEGRACAVLETDRLSLRDLYICWRERQQPLGPDDDGTDQFETHWSGA